MTVFHIPSWYPYRDFPLEGIFIKDYIYQFAALYPQTRHIVSNQQEYYYPLSLKKPASSIQHLLHFLFEPRRKEEENEGVHTLFTAKLLEYSSALGYNVLEQLGKRHKENFKKALAQYKQIDLIHAHVTFPGGIIAKEIADQYNIPYLITEHSGPFPFPFILNNPDYLCKLKDALKGAAAVVGVSKDHADSIRAYTSHTVKVIYNSVKDYGLAPEGQHAREQLTFLCVAVNLDEKKGVPQLLEAFAEVAKTVPDVKLRLAGNAAPGLKERIRELRLEGKVELLGPRAPDDIRALMAACDVYVMPSQRESFGLVYVEAIMAGKPLIATRCGGPEDIVTPGNGLLVPVDDCKALVEALQYMIQNKHNYDAAAIRAEALARFSPSAITSQYAELYRQVTAPR